jgi:hypothetical protein
MSNIKGARRVYDDDLVDGVAVGVQTFHLLTFSLPASLREELLAEFEQLDGEGVVRIERSAFALLCWLNK